MALRPQCNRIAMSFTAEAAYGTAVNNADIVKRFDPTDPIFINPTKEKVDDADRIKGHEFPSDPDNQDIIIAKDLQIPFTFDASAEILGMLLSNAFGADTVSGSSPNYTHTFKAFDTNTSSDQFPSASWMLGLVGDTSSFRKAKGLIVNDLTVGFDNQGFGTISGTAFADGTLGIETGYTFPTTEWPVDFLVGTQCDFLIEDTDTTPVSQKSILRSFELSVSNNLDVADARGNIAKGGVNLTELRTGNREYSLTVTIEGHISNTNDFWNDFMNDTEKDVILRVTKNSNREFEVRFRSCKAEEITPDFSGIRDTLQIRYKAFYNSTDSSPIKITVKNGDSAYLG